MKSAHDNPEMRAADKFDNSFEIALPVTEAWRVLTDIPRIASYLPGAELTEVMDGASYKGRISVPLGPVSFAFDGVAKIDEIDADNHTAHITAKGVDAKGRGEAVGSISFELCPSGDGSKVLVRTDLALSGAVAEFGRNVGIIRGSAERIITKFADNLRTQIPKWP